MALASQTVRAQEVGRNSKHNFQSPRKKRKRAVIAILAAVVLAGGGYGMWKYNHSKTPAAQPNDPTKNSQASTNTPAPSNTNIPVPVENKPTVPPPSNSPTAEAPRQPDVLTMGKQNGQPAGGSSAQPVNDPLAKPSNPPAPAPEPQKKPDPAPPVVDQTKTAPAVTPPPPPPPADDLPAEVSQAIEQAKRAMSENRLVEARTLLNNALSNPKTKESEKEGIRSWLTEVNQTLVFSPTVAAGDPFSQSYKIVSGDNLEKIAKGKGLAVDRRLLARVNKMSNPDALKVGQALKLVHGPFHAVVHKSAFRLDLYAGTPVPPGSNGTPRADGTEEGWVFIRSFQVGLGTDGGTPLGSFIVKKNSKLVNPPWVNPRTGEKFGKDDPKNPIGEHWLGLLGTDENTKKAVGYGLHGTIDPDSIGKEKSMGCVRMRADDIALVWEMLAEEVSTVRILP